MTPPDAPAARRRKLLALTPLLLIVVGSAYALYRAASSPAVIGLAAPRNPEQGPPRDELLARARQALRNNKFDLAAAELAKGVERFPNDQPIRLAYAEALMSLEKFADAYEQYDHAVALGSDRAEYRFAAGMAASKAGLEDHAEAQWIKARELDKSNPQYPLFLAQLQRKKGRPADARANLVIAATLDPNLAVAWGSLAAIALDENHLGPALQHAEKAVRLDPTNPLWRVLQSKVLRRDNRPREALAIMTALPEVEQTANPAVIDELSACHGMLGDPRAAADVYIRAAEAAPDNADHAYQAALWLQRAGDPERARAYARRAGMLGKDEARRLAATLDAEPSP